MSTTPKNLGAFGTMNSTISTQNYPQQYGWNGIDTSSYRTLPTYTTEHIFHILDSMFKLSLEQKQIQLLQDLYNSNDEANRTMATSMFHAMLLKKEEDK